MEHDLKHALRSKDTAERACGKSKQAYKAMRQLNRDLERRLDLGAEPDVHVEGESAKENDDVTMTSTSQEDVTGN